jgi:CubicO group peptidase (beta-lactamase class C family)
MPKLKNLFYNLEKQIEDQMSVAHVPGLALAIVQHQDILYAKGFGVTSVEDGGLPVTPRTLFRIGSITKPLTGTAAMRLVESGKLDLDRPVRDYLPWFTLSEKGAAQKVTLRMLMSHTAGLPTNYDLFGRRDPIGLETYVRETVPRYPLIAPPGKVYSYTNPGISVVGHLAEVVTGQSFAELMQDLVFDPLEMQRTTFDPTVAMTYPLAQPHDLNGDGTLSVQHRFADNVAGYPAGFALSTVLDLTNFAVMQMSGGCFHQRQILSPESVAEMHTTQADLYTTTGGGYGLTFAVETYKGLRRVRHNGFISTFGSRFVMAPHAGVAVIVLSNRLAHNFAVDPIIDRIFDRLLGLPEETPLPQPIAPDRSLWPSYAGTYLGPYCGLATISVVDDRLTLDWNGGVLPLHALKSDLYFSQKPKSEEVISIGFIPEGDRPTQHILVNGSPCRRIERDPSFIPDPTLWTSYIGTYAGDLDTLTFRIEDGRLLIHSAWRSKEVPCIPLDHTRFACQLGLVEFHETDEGTVPIVTVGTSLTFRRKPSSSGRSCFFV